jgi:hypothetical protein
MKIYFVLLCSIALVSACRNKPGNTADQQLRTENFRLKQENDSLKRLIAKSDISTTKSDTLASADDRDTLTTYARFPGKHALTLQWISWDFPGSVNITKGTDGWYNITGQQVDRKNNQNYLKIKGKIKPVNAFELEFDGEIETRVETLNGGKPCLRTGRKIFKATGTRKYWRLQDMINCEGGMVTDYVDIYF